MRSGFGLRDADNCGPVAYTWIALVSCNLLETWRCEFMAVGGDGGAPPSRQEAAHSLFGKRWITSRCYDRWVYVATSYWGSWLVGYTSSLQCNNWSLPVLTSWLYMWQFKSLHHQSNSPQKKTQKLNKHNRNLRGVASCVSILCYKQAGKLKILHSCLLPTWISLGWHFENCPIIIFLPFYVVVPGILTFPRIPWVHLSCVWNITGKGCHLIFKTETQSYSLFFFFFSFFKPRRTILALLRHLPSAAMNQYKTFHQHSKRAIAT